MRNAGIKTIYVKRWFDKINWWYWNCNSLLCYNIKDNFKELWYNYNKSIEFIDLWYWLKREMKNI